MSETDRVGPQADAEPPRWLDQQELSAWMSLAGVVIRLPQALDAQLQRDAGLSFFEYGVLASLSEAPQRTLRMSHLAALANGSLSRLSHVVKRLEKRDLVRRELDPDDGRFTNALLTEEGYALVEAAAPGHVATVRALVVDVVDKEQLAHLQAIGDRIRQQIAPTGTWLP